MNQSFDSRTAAIIGAGTMGADIVAIFSAAGWTVHVVEPARNRWDASSSAIRQSAAQLENSGAPGQFTLHEDLPSVPWRAVCIAIECAPESLALKQRLFAELSRLAAPDIPLASNSSSFPISDIARALDTGHRMLGLHFFMPAHLVPAVEVVRGEFTDPDVCSNCARLLLELGKVPVHVKKDVPGFLANRLQHALMREAFSLIEQGLASPEDVDNAVRYGFGLRYLAAGPVLQKDLAGLDIHCAAATTMYPHLANDTVPAALLRDKVAAGRLGVKSGEGFYRWTPESTAREKARYHKALLQALAIIREDD